MTLTNLEVIRQIFRYVEERDPRLLELCLLR
jgi:hypothetical protein